MLVLFSGVPSSGKTTLARATAQHFKLPLFSRDTLQGFLYQNQLVDGNTVDGYHLMFTLVEAQLELGLGAVLEGTFPYTDFRNQAQSLAETYQQSFKAVHCVISDPAIWKERWHARRDNPEGIDSHWMNFTWDDVLRIERNFEAWQSSDVLTLDAINPLDSNTQQLIDFLSK